MTPQNPWQPPDHMPLLHEKETKALLQQPCPQTGLVMRLKP
jgi:hypothetical protein